MKRIRKAFKFLLYLSFLALILLVALEIIYRTQLIDLYRTELTTFNTPQELADTTKPTILIAGDSYTAGNYTWAYHLKSALPDHRVINSGVSGTGSKQTTLMAPGRFREFQPDLFIYQIYVGNDLFDLRYPVNWKTVSVAKNLYWIAAQRLRSLSWLNYRLGQVITSLRYSQEEFEAMAPVKSAEFDPKTYSQREIQYLQADPNLIEDQIYLEGGRDKDMKKLLKGMEELQTLCTEANIPFYLLVVPHPAQVSREYYDHITTIGATMDREDAYTIERYPFLKALPGKVWNPLPFLRSKEAAGQRLYFANDAHLNEEGQRELAEWITQQLP